MAYLAAAAGRRHIGEAWSVILAAVQPQDRLAAGLGGHGVRVGTRGELKAALDRAVATRGQFQLIEITLQRGVLSSTLQRFVAGVKRLSAVK